MCSTMIAPIALDGLATADAGALLHDDGRLEHGLDVAEVRPQDARGILAALDLELCRFWHQLHFLSV